MLKKRKIILLIVWIGISALIIIVCISSVLHGDGYITPKISILVTDTDNKPIENTTILFFSSNYEEQDWNEYKSRTNQATSYITDTVKTDSTGKTCVKGKFPAAFHFPIRYIDIWGTNIIRIEKPGYKPERLEIKGNENKKKILKNQLSFKIQMKKNTEEESR